MNSDELDKIVINIHILLQPLIELTNDDGVWT